MHIRMWERTCLYEQVRSFCSLSQYVAIAIDTNAQHLFSVTQVNALAEMFIGDIHLAQPCQDFQRTGIEMVSEVISCCSLRIATCTSGAVAQDFSAYPIQQTAPSTRLDHWKRHPFRATGIPDTSPCSRFCLTLVTMRACSGLSNALDVTLVFKTSREMAMSFPNCLRRSSRSLIRSSGATA